MAVPLHVGVVVVAVPLQVGVSGGGSSTAGIGVLWGAFFLDLFHVGGIICLICVTVSLVGFPFLCSGPHMINMIVRELVRMLRTINLIARYLNI